jgi:DNA replication protein DnaC
MSITVTRTLMSELKLLGMSHAFDQAVIDATAHQWSCTEFFDALLQAEADHRSGRKTQTLIKAARLSRRASFEDFDYAAKRSITKAQIKELHSLHWLRQGRPLLLIGQTGVGKTFTAQAAGLQACLHGHSVLFLTITEWLERLALARSSGSYLRLRERLARPAVLIIDNFGMRKLTAIEAQDLCEIIEERIGQKSIIFTTQLPLKHWAEVIADPVIADAIRDRLEHAALTLHITGESYRGINARKLAAAAEAD